MMDPALHDLRGSPEPFIGVSPGELRRSGLICAGAVALGGMAGWPLWGIGAAALLPWTPLLTLSTARIYRSSGWPSSTYSS